MSEYLSNGESCHFVFASDDKFTIQLQVAVLSLIKASVGSRDLQYIHVLDCGILDFTWEKVVLKFTEFAQKYAVRIEVQRHDIDMSLFEKFKEWNSSKATYARLLLQT